MTGGAKTIFQMLRVSRTCPSCWRIQRHPVFVGTARTTFSFSWLPMKADLTVPAWPSNSCGRCLHVYVPPTRSENRCCSQGCHWEGTGNIVPCFVMRGPAKFLYSIGYSFGLGTKGPSHKILWISQPWLDSPSLTPVTPLYLGKQTNNWKTTHLSPTWEILYMVLERKFWYRCLAVPSLMLQSDCWLISVYDLLTEYEYRGGWALSRSRSVTSQWRVVTYAEGWWLRHSV